MSDTKKPIEDPAKVRLKNVRLSFPVLFTPKVIEEGKEPKFSANLMLHNDTDAKQIALIESVIEKVAKAKWPLGIPKGLKKCLKDASMKDYDGYDEEHMYVASNSSRRPVVVDKDLRPLAAEDGKPYAGCFVNCTLRLWASEHPKGGKQVIAELLAVQFVKDGEAFGGKPKIKAEEEFTSLEDDDEDLS
jgi:hypothetical protein